MPLIASKSLLITRDAMTILPRTLPAHELEVAQVVFGEDNIEVLGDGDEPIELDPAQESARLEAKWGSEAVEKAFGANHKSKIAAACEAHAVKAGKTSKAA